MQVASSGALDELKSDHQNLKRLFQFYEMERKGSKRERELIEECFQEIEIHSEIEEEIFYPACRRIFSSNLEMIDHGLEGHCKVKKMIQHFRVRPTTLRSNSFRTLMELMLAHIEEEERIIFPQFQNTVFQEESAKLSERMRLRKASLRISYSNQERHGAA